MLRCPAFKMSSASTSTPNALSTRRFAPWPSLPPTTLQLLTGKFGLWARDPWCVYVMFIHFLWFSVFACFLFTVFLSISFWHDFHACSMFNHVHLLIAALLCSPHCHERSVENSLFEVCDLHTNSEFLWCCREHKSRPLFYEYTAHYDRGNGPEDTVGMGFTHQDEEACGRCNGMTVVRSTGAALIAHDSQGARSGVGMGALNYLEHVPVVRNLTRLKFLWWNVQLSLLRSWDRWLCHRKESCILYTADRARVGTGHQMLAWPGRTARHA